MGYYSDVSLVLKKDDFPRLQALSSVCKSDYVAYADDVKTFTRRDGKDSVSYTHLSRLHRPQTGF